MRLPTGIGEAFEQDLAFCAARDGTEAAALVRDVLAGLAWEEGRGVPRRLIPAFCRAVRGRECSDGDVARVLRLAAGYISEAEDTGFATYRIYHQALRDYLRALPDDQGGDARG